MKNSLLLLFFGLFIAFSGRAHKDLAIPVSKKIEGFLVDFKTKSEVEDVEVRSDCRSSVSGVNGSVTSVTVTQCQRFRVDG
jgi:hypothetical protein